MRIHEFSGAFATTMTSQRLSIHSGAPSATAFAAIRMPSYDPPPTKFDPNLGG